MRNMKGRGSKDEEKNEREEEGEIHLSYQKNEGKMVKEKKKRRN